MRMTQMRGRSRIRWTLLALAGAALALSRLAVGAAVAADASPAVAVEAKEIFNSRCTLCHGPAGKGDGPAAAGLNPKPRNLGDPAWQQSVTDEHIEQIIKGGGVAVGKSPMMPANPDLNDKPQVVQALRAMVRGLGKQ